MHWYRCDVQELRAAAAPAAVMLPLNSWQRTRVLFIYFLSINNIKFRIWRHICLLNGQWRDGAHLSLIQVFISDCVSDFYPSGVKHVAGSCQCSHSRWRDRGFLMPSYFFLFLKYLFYEWKLIKYWTHFMSAYFMQWGLIGWKGFFIIIIFWSKWIQWSWLTWRKVWKVWCAC